MSEVVLLIGGPAHGQVRAVRSLNEPLLFAKPPTDYWAEPQELMPIEVVTYKAPALASPGQLLNYNIFFADEGTPEERFRKFIELVIKPEYQDLWR